MNYKPVFIALGSNQGQKETHLAFAREKLSRWVFIEKVSSLYQTAPIGPAQEDFLNQVLFGKTDVPPQELLALVKSLEQERGRTPGEVWGPRTLDIDILIYGTEEYYSRTLTLPHPHMEGRRFVLEPLFEIAGNLVLRGGRTLLFYLNRCLEQFCEKKVSD